MGESHRQLEDAAMVIKKQRSTLDFEYLSRWAIDLQIQDEFTHARQLAGLE
jgi:hypothetical protein